jgi:hypothetical protein
MWRELRRGAPGLSRRAVPGEAVATNTQAHYGLGIALYALKRYDEAVPGT